ncbi:uncharacterized protein BDR25DRAFT_361992 [Lindgomyces ingoldianus]|uniref:Uncharacterized protein n=1 Tax=Lindgomyces ingoldianus TaxID=673940 RepID=A0ACB6QD67_9PLEO|nr:uncharacterized protein BDR25DRAFT_361992 [Lindgomyces ingoldianus]KAF2464062.1 hypothetical protein BDR25DRAFT_361992 [Lindgomyces ingoldianus]
MEYSGSGPLGLQAAFGEMSFVGLAGVGFWRWIYMMIDEVMNEAFERMNKCRRRHLQLSVADTKTSLKEIELFVLSDNHQTKLCYQNKDCSLHVLATTPFLSQPHPLLPKIPENPIMNHHVFTPNAIINGSPSQPPLLSCWRYLNASFALDHHVVVIRKNVVRKNMGRFQAPLRKLVRILESKVKEIGERELSEYDEYGNFCLLLAIFLAEGMYDKEYTKAHSGSSFMRQRKKGSQNTEVASYCTSIHSLLLLKREYT